MLPFGHVTPVDPATQEGECLMLQFEASVSQSIMRRKTWGKGQRPRDSVKDFIVLFRH